MNPETPRHSIRHGSPMFAIVEHGVLDDHEDLTPHTLAVYVALMMFANEEGRSFPSIKALAARAHVGVTAAKTGIAHLIDVGLLEKRGRTRPGTGESTSNEYLVFRPSSVATRPPGVGTRPTSGRDATDPQSPRDNEVDTGEEDPPNQSDPAGRERDLAADPDHDDPQPFELFEAVCMLQGQEAAEIPERARGRQLAVAKRLLGDGVTLEDVQDATHWLLAQSWVQSVDLFLVEKQLVNFRLAQGRVQTRGASTYHTDAGDEQRGRGEDYWFGKKEDPDASDR